MTRKYAAAAAEVAKKTNVLFVDLFGEMEKHKDWQSFLSDGLHLSSKGNQLMWETLTRTIAEKAKSCIPDALPMEFPYWKLVDNFNVDATLKSSREEFP